MRRIPQLITALYGTFLAWHAATFRWDLVSRFWDVDDAYFYLTIARHIARGDGSTFDGFVTTNGYHPLWLAIVAAAFRLDEPTTPEAGIRLVFMLGIICAVAGTWILVRLTQRLTPSPTIQTMAVLGFLSIYAYWFFGLEAHLNVLVAGLFFTVMWRRWQAVGDRQPEARDRGVTLALVSAALVLTRVDLVLWAAIGLLSLSIARRLAGWSWASVVRLAAVEQGVSASLVCAYLLFNRVTFGAWLPISAVLHTKPAQFSLRSVWFYDPFFTAHLACLIGFSVAMIAVAAGVVRRRGIAALAGTVDGFGLWLALAVLAHCLIGILGTDQWIPRYTITASSAVVLLVVMLFERLRVSLAWRPWITLTAAVITVVFGGELVRSAVHHLETPTDVDDHVTFRRMIAPHLTRDAVAFMVDDAGEFSWFCDCRFINGDGLVSNWAYQQVVKERRVREYLDRHGVQYVLTKGPDDADIIWVDGVDWSTLGDQEFRVMGFRASDALAHVGWLWLFRYPGQGFPPERVSGR